MTDEQRALLGDHEAAKRLTEKGLVSFLFDNWESILEDDKIEPFTWFALREAWNTRAAVEMEGMK